MNSDYLQAVDLEVIFSLVLFLFLPPVFSSAHISVIQWSNWSKQPPKRPVQLLGLLASEVFLLGVLPMWPGRGFASRPCPACWVPVARAGAPYVRTGPPDLPLLSPAFHSDRSPHALHETILMLNHLMKLLDVLIFYYNTEFHTARSS